MSEQMKGLPDCARCHCPAENHIPDENTGMRKKCMSCDACEGYLVPTIDENWFNLEWPSEDT